MPGLSQAEGLPQALPDEVELGASHDALDKGYADWSSYYVDASHRFAERHSVYGELRETSRFNLHDREISGGYYYPLDPTWTALLEASASPDHFVLPRESLFGQLQKSFADGWDIQAGFRRSQYNTAPTDLMVLTGERYWGNFRASYKLYLGKTTGSGAAPSHNVQLAYYYTGRDFFMASLSKGRQLENLGPGLGVLITDVSSASLSGRHWLNAVWQLSYEALEERQSNLYTRKGIRLGIRYAF